MRTSYFVLVLLIAGCSQPQQQVTTSEAPYTLAQPKADWVTTRVNESRERLQATEAGQLLWNSIEYHGGLAAWWSNGPLYFRFNYQPLNNTGTPRDTYETADYWGARARHQRSVDQSVEYGWDGKTAWFNPDTASIPYNTRFWALTPYYFVGMPFVFADEGVNLALEGDVTYEGKTYHTVRVTFGAGVGDAPDDYYVLYIDPATYRLSTIRYIVSYPGYFKDGGHSQEKLMTYEGQQTVGEITLPTNHRTFMWNDDGSIGDYVTEITLSDVAFRPQTESSYFDAPKESYLYQGLVE
ncbi:MAG: DUF6503 family protein [Bacteroidota bacterium]